MAMACVHGNKAYKCEQCVADVKAKAETAPTLRKRCAAMLSLIQRDAILRQGNGVADLEAFVLSETGRAADTRLGGDDVSPLVLYFGTQADRDEFMALVQEAKPGMMMKRLP